MRNHLVASRSLGIGRREAPPHPGAAPRSRGGRLGIAIGLLVPACTGLNFGQNLPGGDQWVDPTPPPDGGHAMGAIAVEPDQDQLWVVHEENRQGVIDAHLSAIDAATGADSEVLDVSGYIDRRVVFPSANRMLFIGQGGGDHLELLDTDTHQVVAEKTTPSWYWGTRLSPSGRALVVADNADPALPLHVIDTATLEHQTIGNDGGAVEAQWDHHSDTLLAIEVSDPGAANATAKLLRYDLRDADLSQALPAPQVAWSLAGYDWDEWFSFTWIGISPDDHWAVFPLIKRTTGPDDREHVLLVLDQTTGAVTLVPGAGPVGFTRDSSRIVSYGSGAGGGEDLWLIDPATGARQTVTMPFQSALTFAITADTDTIVCAPTTGGTFALVDPATGAVRSVDAPGVTIDDWISRPADGALWLDSAGALVTLSTADAATSAIALPVAIDTINVLPATDHAVVGARDSATVLRLSMADRAIDGTAIVLPDPFLTPAGTSLPPPGSGEVHAVQSTFDPEFRSSDRFAGLAAQRR